MSQTCSTVPWPVMLTDMLIDPVLCTVYVSCGSVALPAENLCVLHAGLCNANKQNKAGYTAIMLTALAAFHSESDLQTVLQLLRTGDVNAKASQVRSLLVREWRIIQSFLY